MAKKTTPAAKKAAAKALSADVARLDGDCYGSTYDVKFIES